VPESFEGWNGAREENWPSCYCIARSFESVTDHLSRRITGWGIGAAAELRDEVRYDHPLDAPATFVLCQGYDTRVLKPDHFAVGISCDQKSRQAAEEGKMAHDHDAFVDLFERFCRLVNVIFRFKTGDRHDASRWEKVPGEYGRGLLGAPLPAVTDLADLDASRVQPPRHVFGSVSSAFGEAPLRIFRFVLRLTVLYEQ